MREGAQASSSGTISASPLLTDKGCRNQAIAMIGRPLRCTDRNTLTAVKTLLRAPTRLRNGNIWGSWTALLASRFWTVTW